MLYRGSWKVGVPAAFIALHPPPGFANLPGVNVGEGTWKRMAPDRFPFYFYRVDPSSPLLVKTRVVENRKMSDDGATYETVALIDTNGRVIVSVRGTVKAKQFEYVQ